MAYLVREIRPVVALLSLNWYRRKDPRIPLGIAYIYSELVKLDSLKKVIDVKLIQSDVRENMSDVLHEILDIDPLILGISVYAWNAEQVKVLLGSLAKLGYKGNIVLGGPEITYGGNELNDEFSFAHYFVKGYGESVFVDIVTSILKQVKPSTMGVYRRGEPIGNELAISQPTVENSPFARSDILELIKGDNFIRWQTQRGCVFRCSFCAFRSPNGNINQNDLEVVEFELRKIKDIGILDVAVLDPVFFLNHDRAMSILDLISSIVPEARFSIQTRFEHLTKEIISKVSNLNIRLECGLQTLDERVQRKILRVNNRSRVIDIINNLNRNNVEFETHLIYGLPEQDFMSFYNDVSLLVNLRCKKIRVFPLSLLRGTEMAREFENSNDLTFSPIFPREVLRTKWIDLNTMFKIKKFQKLLEDNPSLMKEETLAFLSSIGGG